MTTMTRRQFQLALGLSLVAPAVRAQGLRKLRVNIIPLADLAPFYAAMKNGYFTEEGLDIETTPSTGGAVGIPGLIGGAFDIAYSNIVSNLLAAEQNLDISIIAPATSGYSLASGLMARTADRIRTGKDLEGKSLATNTRNNNIWLFARAWARLTGGDPNKITIREVPFPQMGDALKRGQIDAAFNIDPFLSAATADPAIELVANPYGEVQPKVQIGQYTSTRAFVAKNPDLVKAFLRGLNKGNAWYDARLQSPELADLISGYTRVAPETTIKLKKGPAYQNIEIDEMRKTMVLMREQGMLKSDLDVGKLVYQAA